MRVPGPVRIGWESVKANAVPMAVLWALAIAAVGAYYLFDPFREMLEPVAEWHRAWGWRAAFDQFVWTVAVIAPAIVTFSFPFSLQIHVNGIVCTFWTLMCVQIGRRT